MFALSLAAACGSDAGDARTRPTRAGGLLEAYGTEPTSGTRMMPRSSETTILGTTAPTTSTTPTTRATTTSATTPAATTTSVTIRLVPTDGGTPSIDLGGSPPPVTVPPPTSPPTTAAPPPPAPEPIELLARYFGPRRILVDGANLALYVDLRDPGDGSSCPAWCTAQWLPVSGSVRFTGTGIDTVLVGVIVRADGVPQLTYGGRPLYRLAGEGAGTVAGQGAGGVWFVVDTTGTPVVA